VQPKLTVARPSLAPATLRPGRLVTLRMGLVVGATGGTASVRCSASVAGRSLAPLHRRLQAAGAAPSAAVCTWRLPRHTSGRILRATVTVRTATGAVRRAISRRIV
jgi:hypothetical protein